MFQRMLSWLVPDKDVDQEIFDSCVRSDLLAEMQELADEELALEIAEEAEYLN